MHENKKTMTRLICPALLVIFCALTSPAFGQSLGNAGTIDGTVVDPSGAAVVNATVTLRNPVSGYNQSLTSDATGAFRILSIPPASYHFEVTAPGFATFNQDITIRSAIPIAIKASLLLAGSSTEVTVESVGQDLVETDPTAHVDIDRSLILKLPASSPGSGLSDVITNSTGGVSADSNGGFHPMGDHAQVSFIVDGQPISDQQSKVFSTALPPSAVQSMELITGTPSAEFGDKTSLVAQITTRSGLGAGRWFGDVTGTGGSFGTGGGGLGLGYGHEKIGNFLALDGLRSARFLDTPEFTNIHDVGNNQTIFDRFDYQPDGQNSLHLNLFAARNWIQIPNSFDQLPQDQHQRVLTWSVAPGFQHTFNSHSLLTINPYIRRDQFNYYGSRNPFNDSPATQTQSRQLVNWGIKADVAVTAGHHNLKFGLDQKQTILAERFAFGITDPEFNAPGPDFSPGLAAYDLTRGGSLLRFRGAKNISQFALYAQDGITLGKLELNLGFRYDQYYGFTTRGSPQPRLGLAYNFKKTASVLRAAYSRTMETPFNENLVLANATGVGSLSGDVFAANAVLIQPGFRNQFNAGFQQAIHKFLLIDVDYFWKYTHNAFDFGTLLNTTITFPISWHNSKIDGFTGRVSTTNIHGFGAYWNFGHTRARYFPPESGGLIPQGASLGNSVFRIDHDQAFQSTLNARYQRPHNAEWIAVTWRHDSGLVVSGIPDAAYAISQLTPNQQVTIGLACAGTFATVARPIDACKGAVTSTLLTLPAAGTGNNDHNPDRVKPREVLNLGFGTDNLLHREGHKRVTLAVDIANLTNKVAAYNFLSTFSGTHFLEPRSATARFGLVF